MTEEQLVAMGYRKYSGDPVDIFFKSSLCTHSRVCLKGLPEVFNVRNRPWIDPRNEQNPRKLIAVLDACPTKALRYIVKKEGKKWTSDKERTGFIFLMKRAWKQVKLFMRK